MKLLFVLSLLITIFSVPLRASHPGPGNIYEQATNTSICDYYSKTILGANTAANELLLVTLLVNTFFIGNYTTPNIGIACPAIAAAAIYNGERISLIDYFSGAFNSTNKGGENGVSFLFLDDGGGTPLGKNMSSNGNKNSAQ